MTDIKSLYTEAETVANRVTKLAGLADELTDTASYAVTDARRALEGGGDFDAILGALEAAREALKDVHAKASTILHGLDTLDTEDLVCGLDDAQYEQAQQQYEQAQQQDIAEMALDVERGIRDPEELSRLVHDRAGLAL